MKLVEGLARFEKDHTNTSELTLRGYKTAVQSFADHGAMKTTQDVTRRRVADWITRRRDAGVLDTTIITQLGGMLSILSHLERCGLFPLVRLQELRRLRPRNPTLPTPDFLTREEFARLRLAARSIDDKLDLAIAFAVFAGLRLNEILHLHREDLKIDGDDYQAPYLRIGFRHQTKSRRPRTVPIPTAFARDLRLRTVAQGPLFNPLNAMASSEYMREGTMKKWLGRARDVAELPRATWPLLRHTFASYLRQSGRELSLVSGWMGNTTRIAEAFYAALAPGGDARVESAFRPTGT